MAVGKYKPFVKGDTIYAMDTEDATVYRLDFPEEINGVKTWTSLIVNNNEMQTN